jgi:hypothetical protein
MPLNDRLFNLLWQCSAPQRRALWTVDLRKKEGAKGFAESDKRTQRKLISAELRSAAGSTFDNLRRGEHDLPWSAILGLVAAGLIAERERENEALLEAADTAFGGRGYRKAESFTLALADAHVAAYLAEREVNLGEARSSDKALEEHLALEDEALRSVKPSEGALKQVMPFMGMVAAGMAGVGGVVGGFVGGGILGALNLMSPSYNKVIPATVRLLHVGGVTPSPLPND